MSKRGKEKQSQKTTKRLHVWTKNGLKRARLVRPSRAHDDWIIFARRLIFMSTRHHSFRWLIETKVYKYRFKFEPLFTQLHWSLKLFVFLSASLSVSYFFFYATLHSINDNHFAMIYMTKISKFQSFHFSFFLFEFPMFGFIMVIYCLQGSTFQQRKKSTLARSLSLYMLFVCIC